MKINSNIYKYYFFKILSVAFISTPVIVLFWQANGLNFTEIMILQAIFAIAMVLFEVPTGAFADIVSRKWSLVIGSFAGALGIFIYSLGYNFWQFAVAEITMALGSTFISGADSAFLYDSLLEDKKEGLFQKVYGRAMAWSFVASALAVTLGGIIGKYSLRLTLTLDVPIFLAAGLVALSLKEPLFKKTTHKKGYFYHIYKSFRFSLIKNKEVRWLILYAGLVATFGKIGFFFFQPYMKLTGLDIFYFGVAFDFYNIIAALASNYAHKIENTIGKRLALILLSIFTAIGFYLMGSVIAIYGFIFGFFLQFVRGFATPVIEDYINQIVFSEKRATVMSIASLLDRIFFASLAPFIGFFADKFSLQQAFLLSGTTIFISGTILLLFMKKDKVFEEAGV